MLGMASASDVCRILVIITRRVTYIEEQIDFTVLGYFEVYNT